MAFRPLVDMAGVEDNWVASEHHVSIKNIVFRTLPRVQHIYLYLHYISGYLPLLLRCYVSRTPAML